MKSRRTTMIVLGMSVLVTASLAGCKSSTTAAAPAGDSTGSTATTAPAATTTAAGPIDVCSLISASQASAIVGVTYSAANSNSSTCTYPTTDAPIPMSINISVAGTTGWTIELATIQEGGGATPATFTGVGDHAAGGGNEFGVQSGNWIIDILGGDPLGNGSAFPKSTALAEAIIPQLH